MYQVTIASSFFCLSVLSNSDSSSTSNTTTVLPLIQVVVKGQRRGMKQKNKRIYSGQARPAKGDGRRRRAEDENQLGKDDCCVNEN